ncbi:synaptonemal complex protein 3 [Aphomia sociella]
MSNLKKLKDSKLASEDIDEFLDEAQFLKDSPKPKEKRIQKRNSSETIEEDDNLISQYQTSAKKRKLKILKTSDGPEESRQKLLHVMSQQLNLRKQSHSNMLNNLSDVMNQLQVDYNAMKDNEQKLEHLTGALMKCIQQAGIAYKQKLKTLKDIHATFKKESEDMDSNHKAETDKLANELKEDIKKIQHKVITETKRNGLEALRRSILQTVENNF